MSLEYHGLRLHSPMNTKPTDNFNLQELYEEYCQTQNVTPDTNNQRKPTNEEMLYYMNKYGFDKNTHIVLFSRGSTLYVYENGEWMDPYTDSYQNLIKAKKDLTNN